MFTERASVLAKCPECGNDILIDQVWHLPSEALIQLSRLFLCPKTRKITLFLIFSLFSDAS